ncbi:MAG: SGNH/GDSL hydrolase family protein [Vicinamibacterales bacterium]
MATSLLVSFVVLEVGARAYSWSIGRGFFARPHTFESPFFVTYDWPAPSMTGGIGTFKDGRQVPRIKPDGELRVVCIGGSTTLSDQNPEGLRTNQLLEARFRDRLAPRTVTVLNAGGDGFSTAHTLVNFSLRVLDFDPDVLVVLHNINDLTVLDYGDEVQSDYANKYLSDTFLAFEHRQGVGSWLLRSSRMMQLLRWRVTVLKSALESSTQNQARLDVNRGRRLFRRNLESLVAVARQHGVEVILLTMGQTGQLGAPFARYNDEIRGAAGDNGVALVDADRALSGRAELFLDPVHLSAKGVTAMAALVDPTLDQLLRRIVERQTRRIETQKADDHAME